MSTDNIPKPPVKRRKRSSTSLHAYGEPMVWLNGGALALSVLMIAGVLLLVLWQGLTTFWVKPVQVVDLHSGSQYMGQITARETYVITEQQYNALDDEAKARVDALGGIGAVINRKLVRRGNKTENLYGVLGQWRWIDEYDVKTVDIPKEAIVIESEEHSRLVGYIDAILVNGEEVATEHDAAWKAFNEYHGPSRSRRAQRSAIEKHDIGAIARAIVADQLQIGLAVQDAPDDERRRLALQLDAFQRNDASVIGPAIGRVEGYLDTLAQNDAVDPVAFIAKIVDPAADLILMQDSAQPLATVLADVKALQGSGAEIEAAKAGLAQAITDYYAVVSEMAQQKAGIAAINERVGKTLSDYHATRWENEVEAYGYKREISALNHENEAYVLRLRTVEGKLHYEELAYIVRMVPSNDLSFFGKLGTYFSRWSEFLFAEPREANSEGGVWPAIFGTIVMTLFMTLVVVPFGVLASLYIREYAKAGPIISTIRIAINNLAGVPSIVFGVFGLGFFCYVVGVKIDDIFYPEYAAANKSYYGSGGVLWASVTLALLTLPVVIVATEEALQAVPKSMREGSYGCGASKWQTIRRIVLPRAMPGIMTGTILAMARGAGEVAPLMLVGAAKLAPDLPIDVYNWSGSLGPIPTGPLHLERSFMHLGFHIYDVGFHSQDAEAAKPMVYTTTMLLIVIVTLLNVFAIGIRSRLSKKFSAGQF